MKTPEDINTDESQNSTERPFIVACNKLPTLAAIGWLGKGWQDFKKAPKESLVYGGTIVLVSWIITLTAYHYHSITLALVMMSGFIFVAPVMSIGLYSIARQIKRGYKPKLWVSFTHGKRCYADLLIYAGILMVIFLVWVRAASMIHIFYPNTGHPEIKDLLLFLGIGSVVGSIFAAISFSASAFSLPMLMDKKVDMVTAVVSSINAVLRNKPAIFVWVMLIVLLLGISMLTGFLGFIVIMPVLGYASWHAYRDTMNDQSWPDREFNVE